MEISSSSGWDVVAMEVFDETKLLLVFSYNNENLFNQNKYANIASIAMALICFLPQLQASIQHLL